MAYPEELEELLNRGYRYAYSLANDKDDAFDLLQDSYLKLLEKGKPLLISYLITTIRNLYIDGQRKKKLRFRWLVEKAHKNSYEPSLGGEPYLEKLLSELPARDREIIFLSVVEDYTAQGISELVNMPRGTVLSILSRTKQKLRAKLKENKRIL